MVKTFHFQSPHQSETAYIDNIINEWAVKNNVRITSVSSGGYSVNMMGAHLFVTITYEQQKSVLDEKAL